MNQLVKEETQITTFDTKHESRSDRYVVAPTRLVAEKFRELGFVVDSYSENKVRNLSRRGYQKHMVRLSNPKIQSLIHPDVKLQVLVTNAHDGSSSLNLRLGFFRFVCGNGMIVGETFQNIRIRHTGNVVEQIDRAVERLVAQSEALDVSLSKMKSRQLNSSEMSQFVEDAARLRGAEIKGLEVRPRRPEDSDMGNLFVLFNVVQESLVSGGDEYTSPLGRRRVMRRMTNIDRLNQINSKLFDLALKYAA